MKLRFRLGPVTQNGPEAVNTWNGALENGADLRVNEHQKKRHYRARSTEERRRRIRRRRRTSYFLLRAALTENCVYSDLIHSFDRKSAVEHDGGV